MSGNRKYIQHLSLALLLGLGTSGVALAQNGYSHSRRDVRQVQRELSADGFYNGAIDGLYGPNTYRAIEQFQHQQRIPVTGRLDHRTMMLLRNENGSNRYGEANRSADEGYHNQNIRRAQRELKEAGYYYGDIDGRMDRDTHWAVRQWQREKGLPMTGMLDHRTMMSLGEAGRYGEASRSIDEHYGHYHNDERR